MGDLSDWKTYRGPTRDYDETIYNVVSYGDEQGNTLDVLHNAADTFGSALLLIFSSYRSSLVEEYRYRGPEVCHGLGAGH